MPFQKLAILGGSSPFTAALVNSLKDAVDKLPSFEILLHGRNQENLSLMEAYAHRVLQGSGWQVGSTTTMGRVLDGANIVIHQIRYGGMDRRILHEEFSERCGVPPDETLGPAALLATLEMLPDLRETCDAVVEYSPDAWTLNLTNPLSYVTSFMTSHGLHRCIGLCELPTMTAHEIANLCGLESHEMDWHYTGLNHRGFIFQVSHSGRSLLEELPLVLGKRLIGGISGEQIAELNAVPLKYFTLAIGKQGPIRPGRGAFLKHLAGEIINEVRSTQTEVLSSLEKRNPVWYPFAVVPMIVALYSDQPSKQIVNSAGEDGIVWESIATVSRSGIAIVPQPECPKPVRIWLDKFARHEQLALSAIIEPTQDNIVEALAADPSLNDRDVESMAQKFWHALEASSSQHAS